MKNIVSFYVEKFKADHRKARRMTSLLLALALVVSTGVFWQLHATGIALTNETYCGLEEHTHAEECYETALVCDLEESEGHTHDASCYDEAGSLICELEESEGHTHTEECYEEQLICGLEEHAHTISCMSDETADVEATSDWEKTLPKRTGVWADDVAAIARSQIGYTESTANFTLDDDGATRRGYTRYGAWAGNEYGDWDAMFVSFCLYYAGVDKDDFPEATGAYAWSVKLEKADLYEDAADYAPAAGDLVFFDTDGDKKVDRVGVVIAVDEKTGKLTVVEGDSDDAVEKNTYSASDSTIKGYGVLPEQAETADTTGETENSEDNKGAEDAEDTAAAADEADASAIEESVTTNTLLTSSGDSVTYTTEEVQALVDALPTADETAEMDSDSQLAVYYQLQEAYDAYETLAAETQAAMDVSALDSLFAYFNGQVSALDVSNQNIVDYAAADPQRTFEVSVIDSDRQPIEEDEDGNYNLNIGESYVIRMAFSSLDGMDPGTYYYTIPDGFIVGAQSGMLTTSGNNGQSIDVGSWEVAPNPDGDGGTITFTVDDTINNRVEITLLANVNATVGSTKTEIEVGDYTYKVVDPTTSEKLTVDKTTSGDGAVVSEGKIYWRIKITGGEDQGLAGGVITDTLSSTNNHWYTEDDINDMELEVTDDEGTRHYLHLSTANVTWSKIGWTYTLPTSFICASCGKTITLPTSGESSAGWTVRVYYTSTMRNDLTNYTVFANEVEAFDQTDDSETTINDPNEDAGIIKTGAWNGTAAESGTGDNIDDGYFSWNIEAVIPGTAEGDFYTYSWQIYDSTKVDGLDSGELRFNNKDMDMVVTATFKDGSTITVRNLDDIQAGDSDTIAWQLSSTNDYGYNRTIRLWSKCTCTEDTCGNWSSSRGCRTVTDNGFCRCWCVHEDVTITITYKTSAVYKDSSGNELNLIEEYGGHFLRNGVYLQYQCIPEGETEMQSVGADSAKADVTIPGMLKKELTEAASSSNGQVAEYSVNVNEAMVDLSDLKSVTLVDTMTYNLVFMPYTVSITATDAGGNTYDVTDFEVEYQPYDEDDPNAVKITSYGKEVGANVATITINASELGPYMYTVTYNASFYLAAGSTDTGYTNVVEMEAYGTEYDPEPVNEDNADAIMSSATYSVEILKIDAETKEPLKGAKFGIYTEEGVLITYITTGGDGTAFAEVNYKESIIFHEHTLYYLQEVEAPDGYNFDSTLKYYFWFCNTEGDCATCAKIATALINAGVDEKYVHKDAYDSTKTEESVSFTISNEPGVELPHTGGTGTWLYSLTGLVLCSGAGLTILRRRRETAE